MKPGISFRFCLIAALLSFCFSLTAQDAEPDTSELLGLINRARAEHSLPPLAFSSELSAVASLHSGDMMENDFVGHNSSDGRSTGERVLSVQSLLIVGFGENVARDSSIRSAHNELMLSDGHRKNILSPDFTHIGLGIKVSESNSFFITEVFATLPDIIDFDDMKELVLDTIFDKYHIAYSQNLEIYAHKQMREFIAKGSAPRASVIGGYRKVSQTAFNVSDIRDTLSGINRELSSYTDFGFYAEYVKKQGKFAELYCIYIFAIN